MPLLYSNVLKRSMDFRRDEKSARPRGVACNQSYYAKYDIARGIAPFMMAMSLRIALKMNFVV